MTEWEPKKPRKYHGVKFCYRCGDPFHHIKECTFHESTNRKDNIKFRKWLRYNNSGSCLPNVYSNLFNVVSKPISRWVNSF